MTESAHTFRSMRSRETSQRIDDLRFIVRFRIKDATLRQFFRLRLYVPGHDHDLDGRPAVPDRSSEFKAVERSWHVDVGHDDADVGATLEDAYGLVGVFSLDGLKAGILDQIDGRHAQQWLVLDDQDDLALYRG